MERNVPSAKSTIRKTRDVLSKAGTHNQTRGLQHLRHAWPALWSKVAQHNDSLFTLFNRSTLNCLDEVILLVERASLPGEPQTLLTSNFRDRASRCEITFQDTIGRLVNGWLKSVEENEPDVSSTLDRIFKWSDDVLVHRHFTILLRPLVDVLAKCTACYSHVVAINETFLDKITKDIYKKAF